MWRRELIIGFASSPLAALALPARAASHPLVVIVSARSALKDLPVADLRRIYLSHTREVEDTRVVPFNLPHGKAERVQFDQVVLGMSPEESGRYWVDQRIRGKPKPPRTIHDPGLVVRVVAKFPGAIAYVRPDQLSRGVRPLTLSGEQYTGPEYPLAGEK